MAALKKILLSSKLAAFIGVFGLGAILFMIAYYSPYNPRNRNRLMVVDDDDEIIPRCKPDKLADFEIPSSTPSPKRKTTTRRVKTSTQAPDEEEELAAPILDPIGPDDPRFIPEKSTEPVFVKTGSGQLEGRKERVLGNVVFKFLGIPYAEPPVGELRFKRTVPVEPWRGIKKATKWPVGCLQSKTDVVKAVPIHFRNTKISEDCLYMNIWSPNIRPSKLMPVMVWIHGGAFIIGGSSMDETDGSVMAASEDVVVVTFNYRLAVFGFLDLQIEECPGNMGLWDQVEALKWVKENIESFGGDPEQITLFGQSAGAYSIGLHMLSNYTKHMFNRAILQSGSPIQLPAYYTTLPQIAANRLLKDVKCVKPGVGSVYEDPEYSLNCLNSIPVEDLLEAQRLLLDDFPIAFGPSVDQDLIPIEPSEALKDGEFATDKELLVGTVANEGGQYLYIVLPRALNTTKHPNVTTISEIRNIFSNFTENWGVPAALKGTLTSLVLPVSDQDNVPQSQEKMTQVFMDLIGDLAFLCPMLQFAEGMAKQSEKSVYVYEYEHRSSISKWPKWVGVSHHDEVEFIFGRPLRYSTSYSDSDIKMSRQMVKTWTHFAKTGELLRQEGNEWTPLKPDEGEDEIKFDYMYLNANHRNGSSMMSRSAARCNLFKDGLSILG